MSVILTNIAGERMHMRRTAYHAYPDKTDKQAIPYLIAEVTFDIGS
jgi:hypothetical protein